MKVHNPTAEKAFTLVELSTVPVILGLLVGGILAGQSLIRASELSAVTTSGTKTDYAGTYKLSDTSNACSQAFMSAF